MKRVETFARGNAAAIKLCPEVNTLRRVYTFEFSAYSEEKKMFSSNCHNIDQRQRIATRPEVKYGVFSDRVKGKTKA